MNCNNCGLHGHKTGDRFPAHGKECNNCGEMNHYARVCRSSPKSKNSKNSPTKVHKPEFESLGKAILDLQTKIEEIQTQPAVANHSLQTVPPHQNATKVSPGYDPPFFISKYEPRLPQSTANMLHTNSIEVCQIKPRNSEHIWPVWISKFMHSNESRMTRSTPPYSENQGLWWNSSDSPWIMHSISPHRSSDFQSFVSGDKH